MVFDAFEKQNIVFPFSEGMFKECINFDVTKLGLHIQQLMLKLIQIGLFETPVLAQC
jgi:hypothetical protein